MNIRRAEPKDTAAIMNLLTQVNLIHHNGRPDIFNVGTKYTPEELAGIMRDEKRPILVAEDGGRVKGYAFCVLQQYVGNTILTDIKTLYLDDLCVDENCRGQHIGTELYKAVLSLARELGCYNVTLNVWALNEGAREFYEALGMQPLKTYMEQIL